MKIIYLNEQDNLFLKPSCVALGFFDGFLYFFNNSILSSKLIKYLNDWLVKKDFGWTSKVNSPFFKSFFLATLITSLMF